MFDYPETITIWTAGANDGLGGITWNGPFTAPARIAYKQEKFTDRNGDQQLSSSVCYSDAAELVVGALVYFGVSASSTPEASAKDVRARSQIPSGAGDIKKAWFS